MTQQFGFRASRSLAEVENRNECWDNLGIDRRDLALLVGTSAAGVTEGDYFNCRNLTTFLEPQISGLTIGAGSGLTAMLGKISKNGDSGVGTLSGVTVNNDRAYYNANLDIISASSNSYFSPTTASGYVGGAQYLIGPAYIPSLTISGFNFRGETQQWSDYFVKYKMALRVTDSGSTLRYSPLYLAPPTAVASNVLWFDAEYSTITLDGAGVRRWDDVLLRANASQSEAGSRPTIIADDIAGKRGVAFDGSNDFLNLGTIGGILPTAATVVIAFSLSNALTSGDDVYSLISSLANISSAWRNGSSNGAWGLFTSSIISSFPTAMPVNGTLIVSIRASNAYGLEFNLNSTVKSAIAPGGYTYSNAGNFVIGVSDSVSLSNAFQGSIHSIAFYNTVLSDTELRSQEEYMRWRYGFVFDPDAAPFSFSNTLHDERAAAFRLEDDSILEAA
jgi:hypothetical protein